VNADAWAAFFTTLASEGIPQLLFHEALNDFSSLLVRKPGNCQTIILQENWQAWLWPLLAIGLSKLQQTSATTAITTLTMQGGSSSKDSKGFAFFC
jgi:hypothetical protein